MNQRKGFRYRKSRGSLVNKQTLVGEYEDLMKRITFATALVASFFAMGFTGSFAAVATLASDDVVIGYNQTYTACAEVRATTFNETSDRAQTNVTSYEVAGPGCSSYIEALPSGYLGSYAALLRTNGTSCVNSATTYSSTTTAYKSSVAYWTSGSCGNGQFAARGVGYLYTGSSYANKTVTAPYQSFP